MDPDPPRLRRRNVEVFDSDGSVVAGFWQYGTLPWDEFYRHLAALVVTSTTDWSIFQYDPTQRRHGEPCPPGTQIVQQGCYVLLSTAGEPTRVGLVPTIARARNPTYSNTPSSEPLYNARGRVRDGRCLITGLQGQTYSRLKVTHIFPRTHGTEWMRKGYLEKVTDTADEASVGGPTKIDTVQNVITLRGDLHHAWDNYEFGVDPKNDHRITAFTNGNADINGLHLQLDHIRDLTLRPLDELFTDHFMQGLLKHMKGSGETEWTYEDYVDTFGDGSCDLSDTKRWGSREGKERLELAVRDRLFEHQVSQQNVTSRAIS